MNTSFLKEIMLTIILVGLVAGCDGPMEREAAYLKRGKILFEQGNYINAKVEFKNARQINPMGAEAMFYMGRISEKVGERRSAIATSLTVLEHDPTHVRAHLNLGKLYLLAGNLDRALEIGNAVAAIYRTPNLRDSAEKVYLAIINQDGLGPQGLAARIALARLRLARKDGGAVDKLITEVLSADPNHGAALFLRARQFLVQNERREAIADLRDVLADHPTSRQVLGELAAIHLRGKEHELASTVLQKVVDTYPLAQGARIQLDQILMRLGSLEAEQKHLDIVLKRVPNVVQVLRLKVKILVAQSAFEEAAAIAIDVSKFPNSEALGLELLANVHLASARYRDAMEAYQRVLALAPVKLESLTGLIRAYVAHKQTDKAITYLRDLIANNPENADIHNLIGRLHRSEKNPDLAKKAFLNAVHLKIERSAPYLFLACIHAAEGKPESVMDVLREGLRNVPKNVDIG